MASSWGSILCFLLLIFLSLHLHKSNYSHQGIGLYGTVLPKAYLKCCNDCCFAARRTEEQHNAAECLWKHRQHPIILECRLLWDGSKLHPIKIKPLNIMSLASEEQHALHRYAFKIYRKILRLYNTMKDL